MTRNLSLVDPPVDVSVDGSPQAGFEANQRFLASDFKNFRCCGAVSESNLFFFSVVLRFTKRKF